jgi:hypothetical protein
MARHARTPYEVTLACYSLGVQAELASTRIGLMLPDSPRGSEGIAGAWFDLLWQDQGVVQSQARQPRNRCASAA